MINVILKILVHQILLHLLKLKILIKNVLRKVDKLI